MASYLCWFFVTLGLLVGPVVALNVGVDPAGLYSDREGSAAAYAKRLVASSSGLQFPDHAFEERAVAKALAQFSRNVDCVVIGSSRVMEVSSRRVPRALPAVCASILNLGVSGAGIEDQMTLSYLASRDGPPRKITLGVDPWSFAYGKD